MYISFAFSAMYKSESAAEEPNEACSCIRLSIKGLRYLQENIAQRVPIIIFNMSYKKITCSTCTFRSFGPSHKKNDLHPI